MTQIAEAGVDSVEHVGWAEMMRRASVSDIFVSALSGPLTKQISIELHSSFLLTGQPPPILVSGWPGVIIEKLVAGYLDRCASDVIAVNTKQDYARFLVAARELGLPTTNLVISGFPFVPGIVQPQRDAPIRTVVFADQPTIPEAAPERLYTYRRLIDYAIAHPERRVILKPRHRPDENTFHRMRFHPEDLLDDMNYPSNFVVDYTPIVEIIADVDLVLTFSSTAAIEAISAGCRIGLILDLGVHEKYGNHVFLDSGLLRTFDQIICDDIGIANKDWLAALFPTNKLPAADMITERALAILFLSRRPSREIWDTAYFKGVSKSYTALAPLRELLKLRGKLRMTFKERLESYGPWRRAVVIIGDTLLPRALARIIDRALQRLRIL